MAHFVSSKKVIQICNQLWWVFTLPMIHIFTRFPKMRVGNCCTMLLTNKQTSNCILKCSLCLYKQLVHEKFLFLQSLFSRWPQSGRGIPHWGYKAIYKLIRLKCRLDLKAFYTLLAELLLSWFLTWHPSLMSRCDKKINYLLSFCLCFIVARTGHLC